MLNISVFNPASPMKAGSGPNSKRVMLTSSVRVWGAMTRSGETIDHLSRMVPKPLELWCKNTYVNANAISTGTHGASVSASVVRNKMYTRQDVPGTPMLDVMVTDRCPDSTKAFDSLLLEVTVSKTKVRAVGRGTSAPERVTFMFLAMGDDSTRPIHNVSLSFMPYDGVGPLTLLSGRGFLLSQDTAARFLPVVAPEMLNTLFPGYMSTVEAFANFGIYSDVTETGFSIKDHFLPEEFIFNNPQSETGGMTIVPVAPARKRKLLLKKK